METHFNPATPSDRRQYFVSGETLELWENPSAPFGWGEEELSDYASKGHWEFLFNALVLSSFLQQGEDPAP